MSNKLKIKDIENNLEDLSIDAALEYLYSIESESNARPQKLIEKYLKKKEKYDKEIERIKKMYTYENTAYERGIHYIAGIDEAGRGPLAGSVVAAAVILPKDLIIENVNDSKKLTYNQRAQLFEVIKEKALAYGIGIVDEKCIDEINILQATKKAMALAIKQLKHKPELLLIDAVKLDDIHIEQISIIKGDSLSASIAAASILAKVTRDHIIEQADALYPQYGFAKHKGYGTQEHIDAIKAFGLCPIHRVSFTKNFV